VVERELPHLRPAGRSRYWLLPCSNSPTSNPRFRSPRVVYGAHVYGARVLVLVLAAVVLKPGLLAQVSCLPLPLPATYLFFS
jgi:hypothetical protein